MAAGGLVKEARSVVLGPSQKYAPSKRTEADHATVKRSVASWRETRRQLSLQAWASESDIRREFQPLSQRSLSQAQAEELRSFSASNQQERQVWEEDLWSGLGRVRKRISALGANLRFALNQEDVRVMVTATERELQLYAEQARQQFDDLAAEECGLEESLQASLVRFEGWCAQESALKTLSSEATPSFSSGTRLARKSSIHKVSEAPTRSGARQRTEVGSQGSAHGESMSHPDGSMANIRQRLEQLSNEICNEGGMYGGWPSDDHQAFTRLLTGRFKRRPSAQFLSEVEQLLPHRSHEALVAHVKWFEDNESRQAERKHLLERWRCLKEASSGAAKAKDAPVRNATREVHKERTRQSDGRKQEAREQAERKRRVEEWKLKRQEEQKAQLESQIRQQEEASQRQANERQRLKEAKLQALAAFKQQREEQKAKEQELSDASKGQRGLSTEDRQRIAERNEALLRQKQEQQRRRREEPRRSSSMLSFEPPERVASSVAYNHVQSRLVGHTDAYVDRARDILDAQEAPRSAGTSKYGIVPGNFAHQGIIRTLRTSPSWRPGFGC